MKKKKKTPTNNLKDVNIEPEVAAHMKMNN